MGKGRATVEFMIAARRAGLRYVPVNWHLTTDELALVLQDAAPVALLAMQASVSIRQVPHKGAGPAIVDTASGQVPMTVAHLIAVEKQ